MNNSSSLLFPKVLEVRRLTWQEGEYKTKQGHAFQASCLFHLKMKQGVYKFSQLLSDNRKQLKQWEQCKKLMEVEK